MKSASLKSSKSPLTSVDILSKQKPYLTRFSYLQKDKLFEMKIFTPLYAKGSDIVDSSDLGRYRLKNIMVHIRLSFKHVVSLRNRDDFRVSVRCGRLRAPFAVASLAITNLRNMLWQPNSRRQFSFPDELFYALRQSRLSIHCANKIVAQCLGLVANSRSDMIFRLPSRCDSYLNEIGEKEFALKLWFGVESLVKPLLEKDLVFCFVGESLYGKDMLISYDKIYLSPREQESFHVSEFNTVPLERSKNQRLLTFPLDHQRFSDNGVGFFYRSPRMNSNIDECKILFSDNSPPLVLHVTKIICKNGHGCWICATTSEYVNIATLLKTDRLFTTIRDFEISANVNRHQPKTVVFSNKNGENINIDDVETVFIHLYNVFVEESGYGSSHLIARSLEGDEMNLI